MTQVERPRKCWECGSPLERLPDMPGQGIKYKHAVSWGCKRKNPSAAIECRKCKRPIMRAGPKSIQFGCLCSKPQLPPPEPVKVEKPKPKPKPKARPKPKVNLTKVTYNYDRVDKERIKKNLAYHEPYSTLRVFERDKWKCYLCKRPVAQHGKMIDQNTPHLSATKEHVVPLSLGGQDTFYNVRLACGPCNNLKGNETGMINLIDLLEILPPREPTVRPEPVQKDTGEQEPVEDFALIVMLYITRIAFWLVAGVLFWWALDNQYSIARFMVAGAIVGAVRATTELVRDE